MKRRGLSEIISAVLVIAIVVAGMGIYALASQQRILGDAVSVKEALQLSNDQTVELLEDIGLFRETVAGNEIVSIFLYNYGLKNITISHVFVNGTKNMTEAENSFYFLRLDGLNFTNKGINQTNILPMGTTAEMILNFTNDPDFTSAPDTSQIENIVIITDSNKFIEIVNSTG